MSNKELQYGLALTIGFVAFSLPLLWHDTKHLIREPSNPSPPDYNAQNNYNSWEEDQNTPEGKFRRAVGDGDIAAATALLAAPPGDELLAKAHWHGNTVLFEAARGGHKEMVNFLIEKGATVDVANEWGDTPVNEAGTMGHWEIVWLLADNGANLTRGQEGGHGGLVLSAIRHHSTEALSQLNARGVPMDMKHWNGNTALHEAARSGELAIVDWLLAHGADTNAQNDSGESPISEASAMGHHEVVWRLLEKGAHVGERGSSQQASLALSAVRHSNVELLDRLFALGVPVHELEQYGNTAMGEACRNGDMAVAEWLLQHGANASEAKADGTSALGAAAYAGHFELMWRLHEAGASLHGTNEQGGTTLMSAVHHKNEKEAGRLADALTDLIDFANERGDTAISIAASRGVLPLVKLLRAKGATLGPRGRSAISPLLRAARFKRVPVVEYLLAEQSSLVDVASKNGNTALHEAAAAGSVQTIELLLTHHATLEKKNSRGHTAFLEAASGGRLDAMKALAARGANLHAVDSSGDGALELTQWSHKSEKLHAWLKEQGVQEQKAPEDMNHDHHGGGGNEHMYGGDQGHMEEHS